MTKVYIPIIFKKVLYILNYRRFLDILSIVFFALVCNYEQLSIGGIIATFGIFFLFGFVYLLKYVLDAIDSRRSYISHIKFEDRDVCWFVVALLSILWSLVSDMTLVPICLIFIVRWIRSVHGNDPTLLEEQFGIKYLGEIEMYILLTLVFFFFKMLGVPILGCEYIGILSLIVVLSCYSGVWSVGMHFELSPLFVFYVLENYFRYLISDVAYCFLYWATLDVIWNCISMLI